MGFSFYFGLRKERKMSKPNLKETFRSLKRAASKHSPQILTGLGIAGVVATTVLAVKATPKAVRLVDAEERAKGEQLTTKEVIKTTWKCYIPTAVSLTTSIVCLVSANSVNTRRNAALAAAYKLSETAFIEYKDKVVETFGEKKERTVREKISEDRVKNNPPQQNNIVMTGKGNDLYLEPISMRYFYSDRNSVEKVQNDLNKRMLYDVNGYISLNDLYDELGLEHSIIGYELGWNAYNLLEIDFDPVFTPDGRPCSSLIFTTGPKYDYTHF